MKKLIMYSFFTFSTSLLAFSQGTWSTRTSLPDSARGYGIGFSIGNYGYMGLGVSSVGSTDYYYHDFWRFDPTTNTWARMADFPGKARICPSTFVIGNYGYVVTGQDSAGDWQTENWQYNAVTNKWTRETDFGGVRRAYAVGFAIGGKGFVGTGYDSINFY